MRDLTVRGAEQDGMEAHWLTLQRIQIVMDRKSRLEANIHGYRNDRTQKWSIFMSKMKMFYEYYNHMQKAISC